MRYSLCSRFRGTLLGAALGEMGCKSTRDVTRTHPQGQLLDRGVKQPKKAVRADSNWERLAVLGGRSLIRLGRFDLDDWRDAYAKEVGNNLTEHSSSPDWNNPPSTKAIVATLPIALFFHENEIKLRQNVQQLMAWQNDPACFDGALAVGYAIAQCLNEKLNPTTLIPQTIDFLGESPTQVAHQLAQVQTLLEQGAGLERAVTQLCRNAQPGTCIALAFYCFLSTLEDLRLSVLRAGRTRYQPQITSAISGALSGAYNSTVGIPIHWRLLLSRPDIKPLAAWGMTTEAEMLELSDSLVAVWSGVYDQEAHLADMTIPAIAAPRVIRSP